MQQKVRVYNSNLLLIRYLGSEQIAGSKFRFAAGTFYDFTQGLR